jgi:hypothetical protein
MNGMGQRRSFKVNHPVTYLTNPLMAAVTPLSSEPTFFTAFLAYKLITDLASRMPGNRSRTDPWSLVPARERSHTAEFEKMHDERILSL